VRLVRLTSQALTLNLISFALLAVDLVLAGLFLCALLAFIRGLNNSISKAAKQEQEQ
jgi:hypothetical protein